MGLGGKSRAYMSNLDVFLFDLVHRLDGAPSTVETPREVVAEGVLIALFAFGGITLMTRQARRLNAWEAKRTGAGAVGTQIRARRARMLAWISVFALLVLYHRWYDMGMLFLPAIVALNDFREARGRLRVGLWLILGNLCVLLFVLMRQQIIFHLHDRTGWTIDALYYPARLLLLLLWIQILWWMRTADRAADGDSAKTFS